MLTFWLKTLSLRMNTDLLEARAIKASLGGCAASCGVGDQLPLTASRGGGEYHCFSPAQFLKTTHQTWIQVKQITGYQPYLRLTSRSVRFTSPLRSAVKVTRDGE